MGRDKARLRLGRRTLLGMVRAAARSLDLPVRVIRRDAVPRCGPLGGVYTALASTRADVVIFLSCDMPFVSPALLRHQVRKRAKAVFTHTAEGAGFPFALRRGVLAVVEAQMHAQQLSLQALAKRLRGRTARAARSERWTLFNVNTPGDWQRAHRIWRTQRRK
jgi:molybdopterin-guanine dinucleotide biosynthesis protein A